LAIHCLLITPLPYLLIPLLQREMFVIPNAVFSKNIVLNVTRKGREWRLLETIYLRVQDVQKVSLLDLPSQLLAALTEVVVCVAGNGQENS